MISAPVSFFYEQPISLTQRTRLKNFIGGLFRKEGLRLKQLNYIFCSDQRLLEINQQFLAHDFYTDIITFPLSVPGKPIEGEIYISIDRVCANAADLGIALKAELLRVIFHGALHLCGYRDKSKKEIAEMRGREDHYLVAYQKFL